MNFFKSVFSDDPDPPQPESGSTNADRNPSSPDPRPEHSSSAAASAAGGAWNLGGLFKTLSSKSESIIETYRRDLQEFGTGLKKEIEVAQGSLDEFGTTVVKGTAQIISHGKDAILAVDLESDSDHSTNNNRLSSSSNRDRYYNRFDAAVRAIQGDASTYIEEPEDLVEFGKWKLGFSINEKSEEMEMLLRENEAMEGVYKSVVPNSIDRESFWLRYYYKLYRMKKAEDVRARLVGRMSTEEEDLSWDVDDDDGDGDENMGKRVDTELLVGCSGIDDERGSAKGLGVEEVKSSGEGGLRVEKRDDLLENKELGKQIDESVEESRVEKSEGVGSKEAIEEVGVGEMSKLKLDNVASNNDSAADSDEKVIMERKAKNESAAESDEKVAMERKGDDAKSSGRNDESSVVGSKQLVHDEEEDEEELGWDEIEDLSSVDEKRETQSGSTSKVDLRKRLSAAEEEEDLSWDIEDDDDDEHAKA